MRHDPGLIPMADSSRARASCESAKILVVLQAFRGGYGTQALCLTKGAEITISALGPDEQQAVENLVAMVRSLE